MEQLNPPAIVGEIEAGIAAKKRKQLTTLINNINSSNFDLMDLLYEIKVNEYFKPKCDTFNEYVQSIDIKPGTAYYFVRIKEAMGKANVPRETYEPLGMSRCRMVAQLIDKEPEVIVKAVETAKTSTLKEFQEIVDAALGNVGEEAMGWLNVKIKKAALAVVQQAIGLAKKHIGSVGKDSEGMSIDCSDGQALEAIALDWLSDLANNPDKSKFTS